MKKLNLRKVRWMLREMQKQQLSIWQVAKQQSVSPRHARRIRARFANGIPIVFKKCGRKPQPLAIQTEQLILSMHRETLFGAVNLEKLLRSKKVKVGHNKIHSILEKHGLTKREPKKSQRRKWVRWERKHSNSLWHTDWSEFNYKPFILIEDDASRFIVGYGEFTNANIENTCKTFAQAFALHGLPKQVISDHGTQFVNVHDANGEHGFATWLKELGVKPIYARVKHPQTNGKVERLFQTIKRGWKAFGSLEKAVEWYNKRPHMSLELANGRLRTPQQAFIEKGRKIK
ncbi:MAG: DDE-type integrase/transposase/recombinase [Candidatus Micrarchaeota archaeon]